MWSWTLLKWINKDDEPNRLQERCNELQTTITKLEKQISDKNLGTEYKNEPKKYNSTDEVIADIGILIGLARGGNVRINGEEIVQFYPQPFINMMYGMLNFISSNMTTQRKAKNDKKQSKKSQSKGS